jgi:hypothetical protein
MNARGFTLRLQAPAGAPWIHQACTQDGQPGLDARALRGALRGAYEGLLRGSGSPDQPVWVCRGGDGVDPRAPAEVVGPCALSKGQPCLACQLFGTRDGGAPVLVIGTAEPGDGGLIAQGRLLDRDDGRLGDRLQAAVSLLAWVGRQGPFEPVLLWHQHLDRPAPVDGEVRLRIELRQPAAFPGEPAVGVQRTARALPGPVLRGAIATALYEADAGEAPGVAGLLESARFDWAWPGELVSEASWPAPWPITARTCSHDPSHAAHDVLFDRLAVRLAETSGEQFSVESRLQRLDRCPACKAPMVPRVGSRGAAVPATHLLGRGRGVVERLDAGLRFEGSIRGVPVAARGRLAEVLAGALSFGQGRAQGWGRATVQVLPALERPSVAARAEAFRAGLRSHLRAASLLARADEAVATVIAVTLRAPLLPTALEAPWALPGSTPWDQRFDGSQDLVDALAERGVVITSRMLEARRFGLEAGFSRDGRRPSWRRVEAGAVYVLTVAPDQDVVLFKALEALERDGLGLRCHQGFGRVLAFDPALYAPNPDPSDEMQGDVMASAESAQETALVGAAQGVMTAQFTGRHGGRTLTAVALQRLAVVARSANCHGAVAHWLRAQVGDGLGPWTPALVMAVVAGFEGAVEDVEQMPAWLAYVGFLGQAFTWHLAVEQESR